MSPPRPSVSPLSNAQPSTKASPLTQRSATLQQDDAALDDMRHAQLYGDDRSSSLSEPEDVDDDGELEDDEEDAEGEEDDELHPAPHRQLRRGSQDIDSEAETERLEQTPRKMREIGLSRTPSKLAAVEHADDDLSDPPSPLPEDVGAASSTSTLTGQKRKRSDTLDSPLTSAESTDGESKRTRTTRVKEEDSTESNSREDTVEADKPTKKTAKGKKGKHKRTLSTAIDAVESVETPDVIEEPDVEETIEIQTEEDLAKKSEAMDAFAVIGKQFMAFRDTLIRERVASMDAELALLEQPNCSHPEYLRMVACVEARRQKQDRETRAFHHYKQISIRQRTLGDRAQLHSQYFQTVRDVREAALDEIGVEWYAISRERREGVNYRSDDYSYRYQFNDKRSEQLKQQAKYNHEVSILAGVAKYVGFPAAPDIAPVAGDALDDDLKAMKLARRVPASNHQNQQYHSHYHHSHNHNSYMPRQTAVSAASSERIAHEQFIEQHAWARAPQYSAHHTPLASTPNISHTPEWADHIGFRKPNNSAHKLDNNRAGLFATPSTKAGKDDHLQEAEAPDSVAQSRYLGVTGSSPLQMSKHRLNPGPEKDGWRNYSGTSTIDAPLGDNGREEEHAVHEAARALPEHVDHLSKLSESQYTTAPSHNASLYMDDRPDVFRSAGFRPLDSGFAAGPGSVPSRS